MKLVTRWRAEEYIFCVQHWGDIYTGCFRRNMPFVWRKFPYFYFCQGSHNITTLIDYAEMKPQNYQKYMKNKCYETLRIPHIMYLRNSIGGFTHSIPCLCRTHAVPLLCHALIHTCHAAPLPCSNSAVSFVQVRVVAGNIRTAIPTVWLFFL